MHLPDKRHVQTSATPLFLNDRNKTNTANIKDQVETIKASHIQMNRADTIATTSQKLLDGGLTTFQYMDLPEVHQLIELDTDEKCDAIKHPALWATVLGCNRLHLYKHPAIPFNNGKEIDSEKQNIKRSNGKWRRESNDEFKERIKKAVGYESHPPTAAGATNSRLGAAASGGSVTRQVLRPPPMTAGSKKRNSYASSMNPFSAWKVLSQLDDTQLAAVMECVQEPVKKLHPSIVKVDGIHDLLALLLENPELLDSTIDDTNTNTNTNGHPNKKPRKN